MAKKKKYKKRAFKIRPGVVILESKEEQRKKLPEKLIDAFINLNKTSIKVTEQGVKRDAWTDSAYEAYRIEAKKYLKGNATDPLESGRLIVLLSKATTDIRHGKKKKEK